MLTFKFGETNGGRTGVVLPSKPPHTAINKLNELGLALIEPTAAKGAEIIPSAPPVPEKTVRFYSDSHKIERWTVLICSLPLSLVLGLGYYLLITGEPRWFASAVMLSGFVFFGVAGCLIERQMLKAFACPGCQAPIDDWDTDEKHRILTHCARCGSKWDIEYKPHPGPALSPRQAKRRARSEFLAICSARGAY